MDPHLSSLKTGPLLAHTQRRLSSSFFETSLLEVIDQFDRPLRVENCRTLDGSSRPGAAFRLRNKGFYERFTRQKRQQIHGCWDLFWSSDWMRNWRRDRQRRSWHRSGGRNWRCYWRLNFEVPALNFSFDHRNSSVLQNRPGAPFGATHYHMKPAQYFQGQ